MSQTIAENTIASDELPLVKGDAAHFDYFIANPSINSRIDAQDYRMWHRCIICCAGFLSTTLTSDAV
jgi:hypothetical protein